MNGSDRENLKDLLSKFMDAGAAGEAAEDIERGDELLRAFPAQEPDKDVVADVKEMVSAVVRRRHRITLQRRILAAAVAAAIVVVSAVALKYFDRQPAGQTPVRYAAAIPDKIWESSDITTDDPDIAVLAAEISTIENELHGVESSDSSVSGSMAADDLEMELIGISGDFWKG
ncbi:MAG: hypothetical protein ABII09_10110 [Planctomycetota bacterium]